MKSQLWLRAIDPESTLYQRLRDARKRIGIPERWCKGAQAHTQDGRACIPYSPDARSWGFEAALRLAGGVKERPSLRPGGDPFVALESSNTWTNGTVMMHFLRKAWQGPALLQIRNDWPRWDCRTMAIFNDSTSHKTIIALLDNGIAVARRLGL